jgi:hypothetical protein
MRFVEIDLKQTPNVSTMINFFFFLNYQFVGEGGIVEGESSHSSGGANSGHLISAVLGGAT